MSTQTELATELANELRKLADSMERTQHKFAVPKELVSLEEAFQEMRAANGNRYCSVRLNVTQHDDGKVMVNWSAYDSNREPVSNGWTADSPTLIRAVKLFIDRYREPQPADEALPAVQAVLTPPEPLPF